MKRLISFIAITFALAWSIWITFDLLGLYGSPLYMSITAILMFSPLISALITARLFKEEVIKTSWRIKLKTNVKNYALALFLPIIFSILGSIAYFSLFKSTLSLELLNKDFMLLCLIIIPASLFNSLFAIGEEAGWRGYLTPALIERIGETKAIILTGIIWGIWHTPVNIMGYNYGKEYPLYPILGIGAMCLSCTALSFYLQKLQERSSSIWPPALFHGAINASGSIGILALSSTKYQVFGPAITGIIPSTILIIAYFLIGRKRHA